MKEIIKRGILGIFLGISFGFLIALFINIIKGGEDFILASPKLVGRYGSELSAVVAQTIFNGLLGIVFGGASVIWEHPDYSIAKRTSMHLLVTAPIFMIVSYMLGWMGDSPKSILIFVGIYLVIYIVVWLSQFIFWRGQISQINKELKGKK